MRGGDRETIGLEGLEAIFSGGLCNRQLGSEKFWGDQ